MKYNILWVLNIVLAIDLIGNVFKSWWLCFWWDSVGSSVASLKCFEGFRRYCWTLWYDFGQASQSVRALVCLPFSSVFYGWGVFERCLKSIHSFHCLDLDMELIIEWFCMSITYIIEIVWLVVICWIDICFIKLLK